MRTRKAPAVEKWQDIPGFGGKYQASTEGRIRRIYKSAEPRLLVPYHHHTRKSLIVKLTYQDGRSVMRSVIWIVGKTWLDLPDDAIIVHKNGLHADNSLRNIQVCDRREIGLRYGRMSKSRPVAKVDPDGNVVDFYTSARAAGRANHMSYQTVIDRCNGRVKNPYALDGTTYIWDEGVYENDV